jgi:hypothetical protein
MQEGEAMTVYDRDIFDLTEPNFDLTGQRLAMLKLALYRRAHRRREASTAKQGVLRWFTRHLERGIV